MASPSHQLHLGFGPPQPWPGAWAPRSCAAKQPSQAGEAPASTGLAQAREAAGASGPTRPKLRTGGAMSPPGPLPCVPHHTQAEPTPSLSAPLPFADQNHHRTKLAAAGARAGVRGLDTVMAWDGGHCAALLECHSLRSPRRQAGCAGGRQDPATTAGLLSYHPLQRLFPGSHSQC